MNMPPKNLPASVRQRLYNLHKAGKDDFQRLVTRYALERFLYRLSKSPHRARFVVKGAMVFLLWSDRMHRPTKDLDMLGRGDPSAGQLIETFQALCLLEVEPDGMEYLAESVKCQEIREATEYGGQRVSITAQLEKMSIHLQIDIGFGDVVTPAPQEEVFPALLAFPPARMLAYPRETVIAEKLEVLVSLGFGNSRMKDFYDLWTLGREFDFDGATLSAAIKATFERRGTPLPTQTPLGLSLEFAEDAGKQMQWKAFRKRLNDETIPDFPEVIATLSIFLLPILTALSLQSSFARVWSQGNEWRSIE